MDRFVKLAIIAVVLYFGFTKGLPWIQQEFGGESSSIGATSDDDPFGCIAIARDAQYAFSDGILPFSRPGMDVSGWDNAVNQIDHQVRQAEDACSCSLESCDTARAALSEIRGLISEFDAGFRGAAPVPLNAARSMERINDLLSEAQSLARSGE